MKALALGMHRVGRDRKRVLMVSGRATCWGSEQPHPFPWNVLRTQNSDYYFPGPLLRRVVAVSHPEAWGEPLR